jgi:hypothetical protein
MLAIRNDEELNQLLSKITIASVDITPQTTPSFPQSMVCDNFVYILNFAEIKNLPYRNSPTVTDNREKYFIF